MENPGKVIDSLSAYLYCNHESMCFAKKRGRIIDNFLLLPAHPMSVPPFFFFFFFSNHRHVKFVKCKVTPKSQQINGRSFIFILGPLFMSVEHVKLRLA